MDSTITINQYFKTLKAEKPAHEINAADLLERVNELLGNAVSSGIKVPINSQTKSLVSGVKWGGYRGENCPEGRGNSAHKEGRAVDVFDPDGDLANWAANNISLMIDLGLHMEHPAATRGWAHFTTRPQNRSAWFSGRECERVPKMRDQRTAPGALLE